MKKVIIPILSLFILFPRICFADEDSNGTEEIDIIVQKESTTLDTIINWMNQNGLTDYNSIDEFRTNDYLTREEAAKIFIKFYINILGNKSPNIADFKAFSDIKSINSSLADYVLEANSINIVHGRNSIFNPKKEITKAQAIAIIIRLLDGNLNEPSSNRYFNYFQRAYNYGLLNGIQINEYTLLDKESITRGELATLLYKAADYLNNGYKAEDVVEYNNALVDTLDLCLHDKNVLNLSNIKSEIDCEQALKQIQNIKDWNGDSSLRDSVENVIKLSQETYNLIFSPTILSGDTNTIEYQSALSDLKDKKVKLDSAISEMLEIQRIFADKYDYDLD